MEGKIFLTKEKTETSLSGMGISRKIKLDIQINMLKNWFLEQYSSKYV